MSGCDPLHAWFSECKWCVCVYPHYACHGLTISLQDDSGIYPCLCPEGRRPWETFGNASFGHDDHLKNHISHLWSVALNFFTLLQHCEEFHRSPLHSLHRGAQSCIKSVHEWRCDFLEIASGISGEKYSRSERATLFGCPWENYGSLTVSWEILTSLFT